ncbi:MAG: hypothetical protein JJ899_13205, partial [Alphaproteobacteria bacterium]|nr:hypothetical protein [Alphaproteobacteria bacterium]
DSMQHLHEDEVQAQLAEHPPPADRTAAEIAALRTEIRELRDLVEARDRTG